MNVACLSLVPHHGLLISTVYVLQYDIDLVGLRILSIREMVFTLCLILILDPFFSTNTMPLADF